MHVLVNLIFMSGHFALCEGIAAGRRKVGLACLFGVSPGEFPQSTLIAEMTSAREHVHGVSASAFRVLACTSCTVHVSGVALDSTG